VSTARPPENFRPKKKWGQHFLYDPYHLGQIASAADLSAQDVVLEIGAGTGSLTQELLARAGQVIAVEIDPTLADHLRRTFFDIEPGRLCVVEGDVLSLDPADLVDQHAGLDVPYKVVANLPYYITSPVIRHLLEARRPPEIMVLTVQEEVAQRMCAQPPEMSVLAVSVQFYGEPRIVHRIPRGAFRPVPQVDSAVVRVDVHARPRVEVPDQELFFRVVKAGFSRRRKQLRNALAGGLGISRTLAAHLLQNAGIDPHRRAETLYLEEWARLTWVVYRHVQTEEHLSNTS